MSGYVQYEGTNGKSYKELRAAAEEMLAYTGAKFTWSGTVEQGSIVTAAQMNEIKAAFDAAYDATNLGCNSKNSSVHTSNYWYGASNTVVNSAQNSAVYSSNLSSEKTDNLTAQKVGQNSTVYNSVQLCGTHIHNSD